MPQRTFFVVALRRTSFAAAALLAFFLGVAAARLVSTLNERLAPTPDLLALHYAPHAQSLVGQEADEARAAVVRGLTVGREGVRLVVLSAETDDGRFGKLLSDAGEAARRAEFLAEWTRAMPELRAETVADFLARNVRGRAVRPLPLVGFRQVLVSEEEMGGFFPAAGASPGWEGFYAKYPHSTGVIRLSEVGFSRDYRQAFLYVGRSCGWLCGSGGYALLEKRRGQWIVIRLDTIWVS